MLNAMYIYLEEIFFTTFNCKTSSPRGLLILFAFDLLFGALTIYFSNTKREDKCLMAGHDTRK